MRDISAEFMGRFIRNYRQIEGLTQFELAEKIGIDDRQLSKIERGVHYPSVITFLKIIEILKIDIGQLYSEEFDISTKLDTKLLKLAKLCSEPDIDLACKILDVIVKSDR